MDEEKRINAEPEEKQDKSTCLTSNSSESNQPKEAHSPEDASNSSLGSRQSNTATIEVPDRPIDSIHEGYKDAELASRPAEQSREGSTEQSEALLTQPKGHTPPGTVEKQKDISKQFLSDKDQTSTFELTSGTAKEQPRPTQGPGKPRRVALQTVPLGASQDKSKPSSEALSQGREQTSQLQVPPDAVSTTPDAVADAERSGKETMDEDGSEEDPSTSSMSRKRPRSPTPEDDEPDQPFASTIPRPTIRLDVQIRPGGLSKSDYIVPIPKLSVERLESKYPKWAAWYRATYLESEAQHSGYQSVGLSQQELEDLGDLAKLLQKYPPQSSSGAQRKRRADEYDVGSYDTKDPFVDDSELGLDEPTHIVKTRSDGFYVALGPVELARAKSHQLSSRSASAFRSSINGSGMGGGWSGYARQTNKLLAKRAATRRSQNPIVSPSKAKANEAPSVVVSSSEPPVAEPRKESSAAAPNAPTESPKAIESDQPPASNSTTDKTLSEKAEKKKNKYPVRPVHPQLQKMFDHLKTLVQRASFAVKTKFPPELKPPLIDTAKLAVELDEYNDNFFNYLPSIFPYNRFTMMVRRSFLTLLTPETH